MALQTPSGSTSSCSPAGKDDMLLAGRGYHDTQNGLELILATGSSEACA